MPNECAIDLQLEERRPMRAASSPNGRLGRGKVLQRRPKGRLFVNGIHSTSDSVELALSTAQHALQLLDLRT